MKEIERVLEKLLGDKFQKNISLKNYSWIKVGGEAQYFIETEDWKDIQLTMSIHKSSKESIPLYFLGRGTNMCFNDGFLKGIFLKYKTHREYKVKGSQITYPSSMNISTAIQIAQGEELEGMEYCTGIPGSIGGAVKMNAGTKMGETKDVLFSIEVIDKNGEIKVLFMDELSMEYRRSQIKGQWIKRVTFQLKKVDKERIRVLQKIRREYLEKRNNIQPLDQPTLGSTFKNPEGYSAWKLIDECFLRGFQIGGIAVSNMHSNFLINKGNATANDLYKVISHIQKTVLDQKKIRLEREIKMIGFPSV